MQSLARFLHNPDDMLRMSQEWRRSGSRIVFVCGCFDVLHEGHIHLLRTARHFYGQKGGDSRLVVAVNNDWYCSRKGAGRPLQTLLSRKVIVASVSSADAVVTLEDDTPERLLRCLRPAVWLLGSDYRGKEIPGSEYCESVEFVDREPGASSTEILSQFLTDNRAGWAQSDCSSGGLQSLKNGKR